MRDYEILFDQVERVIHKYNQKEAKKQDYGAGVILTQTEIHLVAAIGGNPGIGVKALAEMKGVTVGAASQMIKKLVQKGLVRKQTSAESEAKMELTLTDKGQICFTNHQKYHEEANQKWYRLFDGLNDESYDALKKIVDVMEEMLQ